MTTLADKITQWRLFLNDTVEPYAWSDVEFGYYADDVVEELCDELHIIEDRSNATDDDGVALTQITLVTDQIYYAVSPKIVRITKAKISGYGQNLGIKDLEYMETNLSNWENSDSATPIILVEQGVGDDTVAFYPPPKSDLNGTVVNLVVARRPLVSLDGSDPSNSTFEIPDWAMRHIDNGVYREAYSKHDEDTESNLSQRYAQKFDDDKRELRNKLIRKRHRARGVTVNAAFA